MNSTSMTPATKDRPLSIRQFRFVREHTHCALCENELKIQHKINTEGDKVKEEAHCVTCAVRVRSHLHTLH